MDYYL